ncbi:MAG: MAPEG family protein [Proteobacteria bacterium]|nr:MAPEG family protein [Pseudomonadota bacterium]
MTASPHALVYPMFAMVLLTIYVLVRLFRSRVGAVKSGQLAASYFRLYQGAVEPESTAKNSRHFSNLFEAPTLFYAVCIAAMVTQQASVSMLVLAWAYVAARIVHAAIHMGPNRLRHRIRAYFISWLVLGAMWVNLVIAVATSGHG